MIETHNLVKVYRQRRVVNDVSINVNRGEVVGLLGPNGAGKTTTFYMVTGLVRPNAGEIRLDGENVSALPMHLRARKGIGYLAQEPSVFRKLSVEENLLAVWELLGLKKAEQKERLEELLDEFHIQRIRHSRASSSRGASGDGSRSPGPWRPTRASSCWTSPSAASIPSPSRTSRR